MTMRLTLFFSASMLIFSNAAIAQQSEGWPPRLFSESVRGCMAEFKENGAIAPSDAADTCRCMMGNVEREFTAAEFGYFIENRKAPGFLERFEETVAPCFE